MSNISSLSAKKLCSRLTLVEKGENDLFNDGYCVVEDKITKHRVVVEFDEDVDDRIFSFLNKILSRHVFRRLFYVAESKGFIQVVLDPMICDLSKNEESLIEFCCENVEFDSWCFEIVSCYDFISEEFADTAYLTLVVDACVALTKNKPFFWIRESKGSLTYPDFCAFYGVIIGKQAALHALLSSSHETSQKHKSILKALFSFRYDLNCGDPASVKKNIAQFLALIGGEEFAEDTLSDFLTVFSLVKEATKFVFPTTQCFSRLYPKVNDLFSFCVWDMYSLFVPMDYMGHTPWFLEMLLEKTTPCRAIPRSLSSKLNNTVALTELPVDHVPLRSAIFVFEDWEYDYLFYFFAEDLVYLEVFSLKSKKYDCTYMEVSDGLVRIDLANKVKSDISSMLMNLFAVSSTVKDVLLSESTGDFRFNKTRRDRKRIEKIKNGRPVCVWQIEPSVNGKGNGDASQPKSHVCTHWRKGHFAKQRYGKGNEKIKVIWRQPILVNADND